MSEAFRKAELSWSKVRELTRHVTSTNDVELTRWGQTHSFDEVKRMGVTSPTWWRRQQRDATTGAAGSKDAAERGVAPRPAQDRAVPAAGADVTGSGDWAICCSGGGIRSAAYCLGALQSLDIGGLLGTAKWILGVSGGSYIASSRALVAHNLPPGTVPHAYAPGTAEERNLRDNSRYIAPNGATVLVGVLSLLLPRTAVSEEALTES